MMLMTIHADDPFSLIKTKFEAFFPGLSLEIFKTDHSQGEGTPARERIPVSKRIGEVSGLKQKVTLIIEPHMTVAEVEQIFRVKAGLNAQIFRKMGRNWIETVHTDSYTLQKQMEMSAETRAY